MVSSVATTKIGSYYRRKEEKKIIIIITKKQTNKAGNKQKLSKDTFITTPER